MGEVHDIFTGELIKVKGGKSKFKSIGRHATKPNLVVVGSPTSDVEKITEAAILGVALSEAVTAFGDPKSGITRLEVEALIEEHTAVLGELSPTDQDLAIEQTNQILNNNGNAKES
jgi:hypothetical protein